MQKLNSTHTDNNLDNSHDINRDNNTQLIKSDTPISSPRQRVASAPVQTKPQQSTSTPNNTGLPDNLKSGIEAMSGYSMDDVKVHYNSSKPAQLNAHAYAQGTDIHLGSGQEKHLPHEAWHVVQQKQGRVQATRQMKAGVSINDDEGLEREADVMGEQCIQVKINPRQASAVKRQTCNVIQYALATDSDLKTTKAGNYKWMEHRTEVKEDGNSKGKIAEGRGAKLDNRNINLKSNFTWDSVDKCREGSKMTAKMLGPDHKLGSAPDSKGIWADRRRDLSRLSGKKYIAGHLLNDNLGGPGNMAENLTAIPSHANSEHSTKVEEPIKKAVNEQGNWMHYSVTVSYGIQSGVTHDKLGYSSAKEASEAAGYNIQDDKLNLRYANNLKCTWGGIDFEGNCTGSINELNIPIEAPGGKNVKVDAIKTNHSNNNKEQAKTTIGESLVLSNRGDLRAAHKSRKPLIKKIEELEGVEQAEDDDFVQPEEDEDEKIGNQDSMYITELQDQLSSCSKELNNKNELVSLLFKKIKETKKEKEILIEVLRRLGLETISVKGK